MSLKPHTDSPRRKDRTISKPEAEDIIERGQYAVLALHSVDKYPYCVPINYAKIGKILYFHCAEEGKKLDCIKSNQYAMVCVVENSQVAAAEFSDKLFQRNGIWKNKSLRIGRRTHACP